MFINLLFYLLFTNLYFVSALTPLIDFVSLRSDKQGTDTRIASLLGGATLYIRGSGLSSDPSTTEVRINSILCPIQISYTSSFQIACTVPASTSPGSFPISVYINKEEAQCSPSICTFVYNPDATPILQFIIPSAINPNSDIYFEGILRIQSSTDLQLMLNNNFCDFSPFGEQTFSPDILQIARCRVSTIPVGFYKLKLTSTLHGDGFNILSTKGGFDLTGGTYDLAVIPQITGLNSNSGPTPGRILLITGFGFSRTPEENVVSYEGSPCYVLSSSYTFIECILHLPQEPDDVPIRARHAGIKAKLFNNVNSLEEVSQISSSENENQQTLLSFEVPYNSFLGYSAVLEGFFKAPLTGLYRFFLSSNGPSQLFISTTPLSTENLNLIAHVQNQTELRNFFNPNETQQISESIRLESNKFYFIRALHLDSEEKHLTVGVEIPTINRTFFNPREVISIEIQADVEREEAIFTFLNSPTTARMLFITNGSLLSSRNLTYPSTPDEVRLALADLNIQVVVLSQTFFNDRNNPLDPSQSNNAVKVSYLIRFLSDRGTSLLPGLTDPSLGGFAPNPKNKPTSLVSGSYELSLMGTTVSLQFNETPESIEKILDSVLGQVFSTRAFRYGDCEEGCSYVIQFIGYPGDINSISLGVNSLSGGRGNPTVRYKVLQNSHSNFTVISPIPYDLLFSAETLPQVTVTTNNILASCTGNCSYTLYNQTDFPTVIEYSIQGSTIEIDMINAVSFSVSQLRVFFGGSQALVTSYNVDSSPQTITATLPANSNKTPIIVAGTHYPIVSFDSQGLAAIDPSVTPLNVDPIILSVQAFRTGSSLTFIVQGTGFGISLARQFSTIASIGGVPCVLQVLSNTQLRCLAQITATVGPFTLEVNGEKAEYPFVFGDPDIIGALNVVFDSVNNQSLLEITGSGYNSNTTAIIRNDETGETESCRVCLRTSEEIQCSLRGLQPGNYTVFTTTFILPNNLLRSNKTFSVPFEIYSVSPNTGSQLGGTLLSIKGKGFSPVINQNQISIGPGNVGCTIVEASQTEIICITNANLAQYIGPQEVVAWYRLEFSSQCLGNCTFTYSDSSTPSITEATPLTIQTGQELTLIGTGFTSTTEIRIDNNLANVVSVTPEQLVVKVPDIVASKALSLSAVDPSLGNYKINSNIVLSSILEFVDISPKAGSTAGTIITLQGFGFNTNIQVKVGDKECDVLSQTSTEVTCKTAPESSGFVTIIQGQFKDSCSACKYTNLASLTPVIQEVVGLPETGGLDVIITFKGKYLNIAEPIDISFKNDDLKIQGNIQSVSSTAVSVNFPELYAGKYELEVRIGTFLAGFVNGISNIVTFDFPLSSSTVSTDVSIGGGLPIFIQTSGIPDNTSLVDIKVAGFNCPITASTFNKITCMIPPLRVPLTQRQYQLVQDQSILQGSYITSSPRENASLAFDGNTASYFISYSQDCYFGIDVGEGLIAQLSIIEFFPQYKIDVDSIRGAVFEGSNDGINYELIASIQENVYEGINRIIFDDQSQPSFRFIRYRKAASISNCQIAELKFKGILLSSVSVEDLTSVSIPTAIMSINGVIKEVEINVNYRIDATPFVNSITPTLGSSSGGTKVTISGQGFSSNSADVKITIDGIICKVNTASLSEIVCITGALPAIEQRTNNLNGKLEVFINGKGYAITNRVSFLYAERWSDPSTWGCDGLPSEGDSVHVPIGMNLLVDISPSKLVAVVVEGALIFEDTPIDFQAEYIMIRNGFLRIGTEDQPIQSKITITLSGDRTSNPLPIFGSKVIGAYEGVIDIHGKSRAMTATSLKETAIAGQNYIIVESVKDLAIGEEIVISTTSLDYTQSEKRTVLGVKGNNITLDSPLEYIHLSETVDLNSDDEFAIKAVVIVLTRNIVIKGDENSESDKYGTHILFYDPGTENTVVRISYAEITQAGQAGLKERYALNFLNAGNQIQSFVKGCSFHTIYNKALQLRGVDYLTITNNVFFDIEGDGITLTDGVERFNIIEDNNVVGVKSTLREYNADLSPAAISITNPLNFVRRNKAVGVVRTGFKLNYVSNARGAFFSFSICPQGERLGAFEDNSALSCGSFCYLSASHFPRTYACKQPISTLSTSPLQANLPVNAVYKNFQAARSQDAAIAVQDLGAVILDKFVTGGNIRAGIEVKGAGIFLNSTKVTNSYLLGKLGLSDGEVVAPNYIGLIPPNSEGFMVENTAFINFGPGTVAIASPLCGTDASARTTFSQMLTFDNVSTRIAFVEPYTHIFRDLDGSLTNLPDGGTVVYGYPHLKVPQCIPNDLMLDSLVCDPSVELRRILFFGSQPSSIIKSNSLRIVKLDANHASSDVIPTYIRPRKGTWSAPFIPGSAYQLYFGQYDFTQLKIEPSIYYQPNELPITLVFNYTEPREDFDILKKVYLQSAQNLTNSTTLWKIFNPGVQAPSFGDFYNDVESHSLYVGIAREPSQSPVTYEEGQAIQVTGFLCKLNCPLPLDDEDSGLRTTYYWSETAKWPNKRLPQEGETVIIPAGTAVILDIDPPVLETLEIRGELIFDSGRLIQTLTVKKIWVRGKLTIGSADAPFERTAIIKLVGTPQDTPLVVNFAVNAGTKVLAVTGELNLFGKPVKSVTRLMERALPGSKEIVVEGDLSSFNAGDEILIAASLKDTDQTERKIIQAIDGNKITFDTPLKFFHYGSNYLESTTLGDVDMRTEVILLSRNIKIQGDNLRGYNAKSMGARVVVTEEYADDNIKTGKVRMQYVAIETCGKANSYTGALTFEVANNGDTDNRVQGVVIKDSMSYGVKLLQSKNIDLSENVIVNSKHTGILVSNNNNNIVIKNNLIIDTEIDPSIQMEGIEDSSAGIFLLDLKTNNEINLFENIVAGCQYACFVIATQDCGKSNYFLQNVAHSGLIGYLVSTSDQACSVLSDSIAYRNKIGIVTFPGPQELQASNLVIIDNTFGLNIDTSLQSGSKITVKTSFFAALPTELCNECYSRPEDCSNHVGILLQTNNEIGQIVNQTNPNDVQIDPDGMLDSLQSFNNNTFANFDENLYPQCSSGIIISPNQKMPEYAPLLKISQSNLINVSPESLTLFSSGLQENSTQCEGLPCTGSLNILIKDRDGSFVNDPYSPATILPNNPGVIDTNVCSLDPKMNGYICKSSNFSMLTFESIDEDPCSVVLSPVNITNENGFSNQITGFKFDVSELNCSSPRFTSIVQTQQSYNIKFPVITPVNMTFQLQGDAQDTIILRIEYENPRVIIVSEKNTRRTIESIMKKPGEEVQIQSDDPCGTNIMDSTNGVIEFKITGESDCRLLIEQATALLFSIRYSIDVNEFFDQGGVAPFIDKVASILNIPSKRIRVVGVFQGSTIIQAIVIAESQAIQDQNNAEEELEGYSVKLKKAVENNEMVMYNSPILDFTTKKLFAGKSNDDISTISTVSPVVIEASTNIGTIVLFYLVVIGLPIIFTVILTCLIYRCRKARQRIKAVVRIAPSTDRQLEDFPKKMMARDNDMSKHQGESVVEIKDETGRQEDLSKDENISSIIKSRHERLRRRFASPNASLSNFGHVLTPNESFSKQRFIAPKQIHVQPKPKTIKEIESYIENRLKTEAPTQERKKHKRRSIDTNFDN